MTISRERIEQILSDCESWDFTNHRGDVMPDTLSNYEAFKDAWGDIKQILEAALKEK